MFRRVPRRAALLASATAVLVHTPSDKLSIYPADDPEIVLQETPIVLEKPIGVVRQAITDIYNDTHTRLQNVISKWIGVELAVERRAKSILAPEEPLTPAALYVGVSSLTGSILTRNRFLPLRLTVPPAFFFISLNYFLPRTSSNLFSYIGELEDKYVPTIAEKHDISVAHTKMGWEMIKDSTRGFRESMTQGTVNAVGRVQNATGLKLGDALGWSFPKQQEQQPVREQQVVEDKVENKEEEVKKIV